LWYEEEFLEFFWEFSFRYRPYGEDYSTILMKNHPLSNLFAKGEEFYIITALETKASPQLRYLENTS
jgi:hypothetical protein